MKSSQLFVFSIPHQEKIQRFLLNFAKKKGQNGGVIIGMGAVKDPIVGFYDLKKKEYLQKKFKGQYEMVSLIGTITFFRKAPLIHLHASFANSKFQTISGHLIDAEISGTSELFFFPFEKKVFKKVDLKTGLKVLR